MARKPRIEVDGGLYHLITRGNARQDIFHSPEDHEKFLALLEKQKKARFSFFALRLLPDEQPHTSADRPSVRRDRGLVEKEYDERNSTQA
jgi:hypothetical protein